ncbi:MAG: hypothetical protein J5511_02445 [Bacilli bacterium]|nr:hypothetical protein [Bacilli bacterium]
MLYKDVKLEKRSENEPKFNKNNKTDRKILLTIIILVSVLLVLLAGFITLYLLFLK